MFGLNAWQFLLYLVALEMVLAPFLIAVFNGYFRAKSNAMLGAFSTICNSIGKVLEEATRNIEAKLKGKNET